MMKYLLISILGVALTLTSNGLLASHVSDPSLIAEGAKIYSENCGRCHAPRPATDYSKIEWSVVMPHMRAKAHLTGKEALAVEAFLDSTLTSDVRNEMKNVSVASEPKSGEALIDLYGCKGCHAINGSGGKLGPDLSGVVENKGKDFVYKKLTDPTFNNRASGMPKFPLTDADKKAIIDFLAKQ